MSRRAKLAPKGAKRGPKGGPKTRNGGQWTEAQFRNFIIRNLRQSSLKWGPIAEALKAARVRRGWYECAGCEAVVKPTVKVEGKSRKNIHVDHREPVVPVDTGFTTFDDYIERLFCEVDNLDVLCYDCHRDKTDKETEERANARRERKQV